MKPTAFVAGNDDSIAFDGQDGKIIIAVSAIEDFVKRVAESICKVRDATPTVKLTNSRVGMEIKLAPWDDTDVQTTASEVQETVKGRIRDVFGLTELGRVDVFVTKTASREAAPEEEIQKQAAPGSEKDLRESTPDGSYLWKMYGPTAEARFRRTGDGSFKEIAGPKQGKSS